MEKVYVIMCGTDNEEDNMEFIHRHKESARRRCDELNAELSSVGCTNTEYYIQECLIEFIF